MDYFKFNLDISNDDLHMLVGDNNSNIKNIEEKFNAKIEFQYPNIIIKTSSKQKAIQILNVIKSLKKYSENGPETNVKTSDLNYISNQIKTNGSINFLNHALTTLTNGKKIFAKTANQLDYVKLIQNNNVVISVGPAGTGKTFLAVICAYEMLKKEQIKKIIITRPIVEAGESIGFLPGDIRMKIDPYLLPLYDAFYSLIGKEKTETYINKGIIEIAPIAYMRGRTFNDAFIILDEAQNTTQNQVKMFLTRMGFNSKVVITGDISQIDLKFNQQSALIEAINVLKNVNSVKQFRLTSDDIVRNPIVMDIVKAYTAYEAKTNFSHTQKRTKHKWN